MSGLQVLNQTIVCCCDVLLYFFAKKESNIFFPFAYKYTVYDLVNFPLNKFSDKIIEEGMPEWDTNMSESIIHQVNVFLGSKNQKKSPQEILNSWGFEKV